MLYIQGDTAMHMNDKKNRITDLPAVFILPLIFLVIVSYTGNGDISETLKWIGGRRREFFLSYLLSFSIVNMFYIFNKKMYASFFFLLTFMFSLASFINRIKCDYRGEPLMPSDLGLGREALNMAQAYFHPNVLALCMGVVLTACGIAASIAFLPGEKMFRFSRIFIPLASFFLLFNITYNRPIRFMDAFKIQEITWDQRENYHVNGFLLGFATNIKWLDVKKPEGYGEQKIYEIKRAIMHSSAASHQRSDIIPDIIVIQSEAFWDVTRLPNVRFSEDPLPFFHSLQKKYTSGNLLVPVVGGATANTEFQVLTGMTDRFLPPGAIVYNHYIRNPMDTIVSALKRNGYKAIAIHSYWNWFYKRDQVYRNFGFDRFVSAEYFSNPSRKGSYIADQEVTNKIIDALRSDESPKFLFAVTMQNHGPYPVTGDYKANIKVKGEIGEETREMIERYADNLYDADNALRSLISEIERENRPAVVIFYGDHLPYLGADNLAYKEAGYLSGLNDAEDYLKMHYAPFVIWDNIGLKKETLDIGANFLLPYVLDRLDLKGNIITDCINQLRLKGIRAIPKSTYDDEFGLDESSLEDLKHLQYDMMFGNGYVYDGDVPKASESYFLGLEEMVIEWAEITKSEDGNVLCVKGKNFTQYCRINVNGENVETNFIDEETLAGHLPDKFGSGDALSVHVNVTDTMNRVIGVSNTIQIDTRNTAQ